MRSMARRRKVARNAARYGEIGRFSALTPEREQTIIEAIQRGNHITTAAVLAKTPPQTVYRWLKDAQAVDAALERGDEVEDAALMYVRFRDRLAVARATAEDKAVRVIERAMEGGYVISEEPALTGDGLPIYDEDGALAWKRVYAQPDGNLALKYLAISSPARWGRAPEETFGPDTAYGDAADVASGHEEDEAAALSARVRAAIAQQQQDRQAVEAAGDVLEGEIVP